jgi:hypothetical protein
MKKQGKKREWPRKQSGGGQVERSPNAMNARSPMVLQEGSFCYIGVNPYMEESTPDGSRSLLRKETCGGEACATAYYVQHGNGIKKEDVEADFHVKLNTVI